MGVDSGIGNSVGGLGPKTVIKKPVAPAPRSTVTMNPYTAAHAAAVASGVTSYSETDRPRINSSRTNSSNLRTSALKKARTESFFADVNSGKQKIANGGIITPVRAAAYVAGIGLAALHSALNITSLTEGDLPRRPRTNKVQGPSYRPARDFGQYSDEEFVPGYKAPKFKNRGGR